jgi:hypothetical protein
MMGASTWGGDYRHRGTTHYSANRQIRTLYGARPSASPADATTSRGRVGDFGPLP